MRHDVHLHLDYTEITLLMANAELQAQITRATDYIKTLEADLSTANNTVASLSAGLSTASDDTADAHELSSALDAVGVPPVASVSVAISASVSAPEPAPAVSPSSPASSPASA